MSLFTLLVPAALGTVALRAMGLRWCDDRIGYPAWAWLVGCLLLGACVQMGIVLRLPPFAWWVLLASAMAAAGYAERRRRPNAQTLVRPCSADLGFRLFVFAGVAFCVLFVVAGADRPCIEGDEGNIWSLKAKSLLVDWPGLFAATQVYNLHPDYPQLNPLLQTWMYSLWHDETEFVQFENRWPIQACNIALFVAVAGALRRHLPPLAAAVLSTLLLFEPEFQNLLRTAYADGMLALGLVVATDAFLRYRDTGDRRFGWLAGLGLAFALWSKNETMLYLASAGMAALLTRAWTESRRGGLSLRNLRMFVPAVSVVAFTALWNRHFGMKSDLLGSNPTGKSMFTLMNEQWRERVPAMVAEAARVLTSFAHAHVVFAVLLLGVVGVPRRALGGRLALPVLALFGAFTGIHVVYVGSFLPLRFHLDTSYARVTFQLLPAALVLLAALAADVVAASRAGHTEHSS